MHKELKDIDAKIEKLIKSVNTVIKNKEERYIFNLRI